MRASPIVGTAVALVLIGGAAMEGQEPIVPVYHEPHHRQVFQYLTTRILDVQIPPGDTSWYHTHESPILYVTLSASTNRIQNLGEDWSGGGRGAAAANAASPPDRPAPAGRGTAPTAAAQPPGRVSSTTSYVQKPVTHRLQNVGERLFRLVAVINETGGEETATGKDAGFSGQPELTNRWFRAYRFTVNPGETTPRHRHRTPAAIVQTTDGRALGAGAMKFDFTEPGRWAFFDAGDEHEIRNTSATPVSFVEVEVRQPAK